VRVCWCGNSALVPFGAEYGQCRHCGTLVYLTDMPDERFLVSSDEHGYYGKKYWLEHQQEAFGYGDIYHRARSDITERNLYWLNALLKYKLPPAKVLEIGCAHGSFTALLRQAGYDASGVEMSPWVVDFAQKTFGVPVSLGPIESLDIAPGTVDVIILMDVLEHLPYPAVSMGHCLKLLRADGIIIIQTPKFPESMDYGSLVEAKARFLEMLIPEEHIYLFSERSIDRLFQSLNAPYLYFEPAIFGHYDMFLVAAQKPLRSNEREKIDAALLATPNGRLTLALMDIYARETEGVAKLKADNAQLVAQFQACEADRTARLAVIEDQGERISHLESQLARFYRNVWVRIAIKVRLIWRKNKGDVPGSRSHH
jgi:2-polyprenyl-3-methyl-5-hydroxy-6-metoxy-1,4-benzoquinol methylase